MGILEDNYSATICAAAAKSRLGECIQYKGQKAIILQVNKHGDPSWIGIFPLYGFKLKYYDVLFWKNYYTYDQINGGEHTLPEIKELYDDGWILPSTKIMQKIFGRTAYDLFHKKHMNMLYDKFDRQSMECIINDEFWTCTDTFLIGQISTFNLRSIGSIHNNYHPYDACSPDDNYKFQKSIYLEKWVNMPNDFVHSLMLVIKYKKQK